ncbi:hypothetical protein LOTGIDRAFT_188902 [Lottia gigantea]|uniref:Alpha-mannosidase n=1 Tax=Lottia gigantea TaxID=225164 RepID=V4AK03_LOTGI|nr:hypothetical protein LOTGIDRAFT_188902 [Lottia gigantea]ESO95060.1 hypothetical protein LOTGIDRAFT_188902 [Lottia gigantea]
MIDIFEKNSFDNIDGGVWKQGWPITYDDSQWNNRKLKVFLIPHSHTDPGWLKTFLDYYRQQTKLIFENMVPKLEEDGRRKFMYAEMSFFSLWWDEIDDSKKARVKKLIQKGQLEIITGGWVMTDEANSHYFAMIDQLIEGHQWLNGTLGVKPKAGWSIDPFGYSSTMAYILREADFSNMLIQRVHYSIKKYLAKEKSLEFMWRQQWDQEGSTDILCHLMPFYSYDAPHSCGPDPKICCQFDFMRLPNNKYRCPWKLNPVAITDNNVGERVNLLIDQYKKKAQLYRSDVLLVPLGDDFRYDTPTEWDLQFNNYQKMIDYLNVHPELKTELQFGTLSDYFAAVYERNNVDEGGRPQVPTLSGDFFSYADREDNYWSGYYTSRPFYKHLDRVTEYHLRSAEVIFTTALAYAKNNMAANFPSATFMQYLVEARRNLGLFQHHDGITGTSKEFVVVDYGKRLVQSINNLKRLIAECSTFLSIKDKVKYDFKPKSHFFNLDEIRDDHDSLPIKTVLEVSKEPSPVLMYNSLSHKRINIVKVYVTSPYIEVTDPSGNVIVSQIDPFFTDKEVIDDRKYKVSFIAEVPALGVSCYHIKQVEENANPLNYLSVVTVYHSTSQQTDEKHIKYFLEEFSIENDYLKVTFSKSTSLITSIYDKDEEVEHQTKVEFVEYTTRRTGDKSGAYLFLPEGEAKVMLYRLPPLTRIIRGPIASEVNVFVPSSVQVHVVRLLNSPGSDGRSVDIYNIVDIRNEIDKEIAVRVTTDINNEDRIFYTDLNGYQMSRRKTYDKLPLQANVYPMPAMMYIEDDKTRFTIISAQSLGCSSLKTGVMEVIMDRRLAHDDNRGLGEGVKDNKATPNKFRFLIEKRKANKPVSIQKPTDLGFPSLLAHHSYAHLISPLFIFPKTSDSIPVILTPTFTPLIQDLPCEIYLLNLRTMQNKDDSPDLKFVPKNTAAMILQQYGFDCGYPAKSLTCNTNGGQVTFAKIFKDIVVKEVKSMSLTLMYEREKLDLETQISIKPMEINTFRITFQSTSN